MTLVRWFCNTMLCIAKSFDSYLKTNFFMKKIIRACTVSLSVGFVAGMLPDLMKKYEVVLLSSPGPEMDEAHERYRVRTIELPMERHISLMRDMVSLWRIIKVFWKERPDMVHSMTPKAGLLCMVAAWLTRVPVRVHTFTGLVFPTATGLQRRILMATDALTCFCATHVIPEGEGVKNDLLNNGITKKPLRVLGYGNVMGIDMKRFDPKRFNGNVNGNGNLNGDDNVNVDVNDNGEAKKVPVNVPVLVKNTFVFLFVGRIVRDKGMDELMAAFDMLSKKYPQTRLVLVGPYEDSLDPVSDETRRIIKDNPAIEAVGTKRGDDLLAYYAAADCFVFPSYREGFPNTVIEAGAMGLPCIVTDINGSREIIVNGNGQRAMLAHTFRCENVNGNETLRYENGSGSVVVKDNGLIIPSKDAEALYEAMEMMMTDEEMRQGMASRARQMIADRFEQGFVRRCLYDFYDEIIERER